MGSTSPTSRLPLRSKDASFSGELRKIRAARARSSMRLVPTSMTVAPWRMKSRVIMAGRERGWVGGGGGGGRPGGGNGDPPFAAHGGEVRRFGMADGHGGVLVQEHHGRGLADDIAAPHDDGAAPRDGNATAFQQLDDTDRKST